MTSPSASQARLRRVDANDWQLWRSLRLKALEEAPYAFSSLLADWQSPLDREVRWRDRLSTVPFNIVADLQDTAAGMVSATAPTKDGTIELISMWVAPFARGRGLGDSLVGAVIGWAQRQQATRIVLAVVEGNHHAAALYLRHGFSNTGVLEQDGTESLLNIK